MASFWEELGKSICDFPGRVWKGCCTGWEKLSDGIEQMQQGAGLAGFVTALEGTVQMVTGNGFGAGQAFTEVVEQTSQKVTDELGNVVYVPRDTGNFVLNAVSAVHGASMADNENAQNTIAEAIESGDFSEANKVMGLRLGEHIVNTALTVSTCGAVSAAGAALKGSQLGIKAASAAAKVGAAVKATKVGSAVVGVGSKIASVANAGATLVKTSKVGMAVANVGTKVANVGTKVANVGTKVAGVGTKISGGLKAVGATVKATTLGTKVTAAAGKVVSAASKVEKALQASKAGRFILKAGAFVGKAAPMTLSMGASGYLSSELKDTMLDYQISNVVSDKVDTLMANGQLSEANKEEYSKMLATFYTADSVLGGSQVGIADEAYLEQIAVGNGLITTAEGEELPVSETMNMYDSLMAEYQPAIDAGSITKDQAGRMATLDMMSAVGKIDDETYLTGLYDIQYENYAMTEDQRALMSVLDAQLDLGKIDEAEYLDVLATEPTLAEFITPEGAFEIPLKETDSLEAVMMQNVRSNETAYDLSSAVSSSDYMDSYHAQVQAEKEETQREVNDLIAKITQNSSDKSDDVDCDFPL